MGASSLQNVGKELAPMGRSYKAAVATRYNSRPFSP
mgnify:CR=1 FL=1